MKKHINIPVTIVNGTNAGISLFIRRSKKPPRNSHKHLHFLSANEDVITYPEITKNISTPKYPLGRISLLKWLIITAKTANALRPSISGL